MSEIEKYRKIYSDPNTQYGATTHGLPYLQRILELKPQHMIDVGCGQNNLAILLREHDINVVGLDPAAPQADYQHPADNIPFPDNTFDLLTAFDVLEHIHPSEVSAVLAEFRRVMTPTGKALFTIANKPSERLGFDLHPTKWDKDKWTRALTKYVGTVAVAEYALWKGRPTRNTYYFEVHL